MKPFHPLGPVIFFVLCAAVIGGLELVTRKRWENHPERPRRSWKERISDVVWWMFTPTVNHWFSGMLIILVAVLSAWALGYFPSAPEPERAKHAVEAMLAAFQARSPVSQLPVWAQILAAFFVADFCDYWCHRVFHRSRWLWPFHAVHHSSKKLDWLAATRVHPINELFNKLVVGAPLLLLGFQPGIFAPVALALGAYAIFIHADVPWRFGFLRFVIATPRFHRWHHTSEDQGLDKNFAGLLPFWDMLFGTFYMPEHEPTVFGVKEDVPELIHGQLLWPFRSSARSLLPQPSRVEAQVPTVLSRE